jgi:hypothetical protein
MSVIVTPVSCFSVNSMASPFSPSPSRFGSSCANDEGSSADILHSITDIMAAADVMDMDKAERSISRILPVRHPWCRESNNYAFE